MESSSSNNDAWVGNPQVGDNEVELSSYNNMLAGTDDELTEGDESHPTLKKHATELADSEISSSFQHSSLPARHQVKMRSQQNVHTGEDIVKRHQMQLAQSNNQEYFRVLGGDPRDAHMSLQQRNIGPRPSMHALP